MDELLPENDIFREVEAILEGCCIDSKMTPEEDWQQVQREEGLWPLQSYEEYICLPKCTHGFERANGDRVFLANPTRMADHTHFFLG